MHSATRKGPVASGWLTAVACLFISASVVCAAESPWTNAPLKSVLAELSKANGSIPFKEVIQATTHCRVLDFETNNPAHVELKRKLLQAAQVAARLAITNGLAAARPNEAGNHIEPFVRSALREAGLEARVPINTSGDAQVTGYPDIEIVGPTPCYLELKTFNAATENTTQRSFYYSPSTHPKVTRDALHFLLAYELEKRIQDGKTVFIPVHWKLLTLEDLQVELKFEFNQSNRGLYGPASGKALLSEGNVD
jgi:hypothetical protein